MNNLFKLLGISLNNSKNKNKSNKIRRNRKKQHGNFFQGSLFSNLFNTKETEDNNLDNVVTDTESSKTDSLKDTVTTKPNKDNSADEKEKHTIKEFKDTNSSEKNNLFDMLNIPISNAKKNITEKIESVLDFLVSREPGPRTNNEKFNDNVECIKIIKKLDSLNRNANKSEQLTLSKYAGWGGLADKFKENTSSNQLLKNLLENDYESARKSTLTAFYTPAVVCKFIYKVLEKMGFEKGRILEPAIGVGNILRYAPEELYFNSKITGVEMDTISAKISKHLYQSANIIHSRFEETELKDDSFDLILSNVPFGDIKPFDTQNKDLNSEKCYIHDYYFLKSIKKCRENGLIILITSAGTMDKKDAKIRNLIDKSCDFIGAVRLPISVFKETGTEVTTDIIFLRKNSNSTNKIKWTNIKNYIEANGEEFEINEYFADNPEMMMGNLKYVSGQFGPTKALTCENPIKSNDFDKLLKYFPSQIYETPLDDSYMYEEDELLECTDTELKEGEFDIIDDKLFQKQGKYFIPCSYVGTRLNKLFLFVQLKNTLKQITKEQLNNCSDERLKELQKVLANKYDNFVNLYGYINLKCNSKILKEDTLYYLVSTLEDFDMNTNTAKKAAVFTTRTIGKKSHQETPKTIDDALKVSFLECGKMDIDFISKTLNMSVNDVCSNLIEKHLAYEDPENGGLVYADEYLSGYTKEKLKIAEKALKNDERFRQNVEDLKKNQPDYVDDIYFTIASTWIPVEIKRKFIADTLETSVDNINLDYIGKAGIGYKISRNGYINQTLCEVEWGTGRKNAFAILDCILNQKNIKVYDEKYDSNKDKDVRVINSTETQLASSKAQAWKNAFNEYVLQNTTIHKNLVDLYNELFVDYKEREYKNILNPRINPTIKLREHQLRAASRIIVSPNNTLLAHNVGLGKTYTTIVAIEEMTRISKGRQACKTLFVVPRNLCESGQVIKEYLTLYPDAGDRVLATTAKDFSKANRRRILAKMLTGNFSTIIIPQTALELIPLKPETEKKLLEQDLKEIENVINYMDNNESRFSVKRLEKTRERMLSNLKKLNDGRKDDGAIYWEDLGITHLALDEFHWYKNLSFETSLQVSGISPVYTKKCQDLYNKLRYQKSVYGNKVCTALTATPISNSMCELYTLSKYLQSETLERYNVSAFDAWASTFGIIETNMEVDPTGTSFRFNQRFSKFCNIPELISMFRQIADVVDIEDVHDIKLPELKTGKPITVTVQPTPEMEAYVNNLVARSEAIHKGSVKPYEDNMLNVTTDGRKMAVSPFLVGLNGNSPKIQAVADNVAKEMKTPNTTHLIFCDLGTPNGSGYNVYEEIKRALFERDINESDIAFIHEAKTSNLRKKMIANFNEGKIRVLIGSTSMLGEGVNCQKLVASLHHVDCTWKPSGILQRNGRILRQGNENKEISIYEYVVKGSFDAYSWQTLEVKIKYINQILHNASTTRSVDDIDQQALTYAEAKACACSDTRVRDLCIINQEIQNLQVQEKAFNKQKLNAANNIELKEKLIDINKENLSNVQKDIAIYDRNNSNNNAEINITINNVEYFDKKSAMEAISQLIQTQKVGVWGTYKGLTIELKREFNSYNNKYETILTLGNNYSVELRKGYPKLVLTDILKFEETIHEKLKMFTEKINTFTSEVTKLNSLLTGSFKDKEKLKNLLVQKEVLETELRIA